MNKCHYSIQHTYTSISFRTSILELLFCKTINITIVIDVFIIIYSSNFNKFLSVNRMLYKGEKKGTLYPFFFNPKIKYRKGLLKSLIQMIFNSINNNILISHPSYSDVYQDEANNWELYKNIIVFVLEPSWIKTDKTGVQVSSSIFYFFKSTHYIFDRDLGEVG